MRKRGLPSSFSQGNEVQILALEMDMKKTAKQSSGAKSPRQDICHSRPKRRLRSPFLMEAEAMIPSIFRTSIDEHLPYRRIIE